MNKPELEETEMRLEVEGKGFNEAGMTFSQTIELDIGSFDAVLLPPTLTVKGKLGDFSFVFRSRRDAQLFFKAARELCR